MRNRLYRYATWGDRKHWDVTVGRTNVSRWCSTSPCGGDRPTGRHRIRLRRWARSWSAADR